jgi:putative ABC transport system permease protein
MRSVYFHEVTDDKKVALPYLTVGHDFATTYDLEIIEGRDISSQVASDTNHIYLVNEAAVKQFNLEPVLGRIITTGDSPKEPGPIVGVVKDFHYGPLHEPIGPLVIGLWNRPLVFISVKLQADSIPAAVERIAKTWSEFEGNRVMDFSFLNDRLEQAYQFETILEKVLTVFTVLAMLVACLGLFGMALYTAEQKTKEIGVRRVLGASRSRILLVLSEDFVNLIFVANVLAAPVAYFAMREWLNGFAYRADFGISVFALTFGATLAIAFVTVSYQVLRAGRVNPVEALRYE